jgi:hypothetical protein
MRTTVILIFRKGKTARKNFNQELNKKKHEENARRKNNYFIEKEIITTP